ncbi:hypothetical protein ACFRJ8_19160 [Arthrobacter sp. NPDC056886]|uniref:hypothetical protein n=1 Tax=Arthrobacter sp. NPDC056886 TaxID=3345960 RepID=UPI00366C77FC
MNKQYHEIVDRLALQFWQCHSPTCQAGMTAEDYEDLLASIPLSVAWITWSEIHTIVMLQKRALCDPPQASLHPSTGPLTV